ncbi:MAG: hypothetical protein II997_05000 [Clostridia bacterium]|nr:hypothetical protein [Clostridia bacterium]
MENNTLDYCVTPQLASEIEQHVTTIAKMTEYKMIIYNLIVQIVVKDSAIFKMLEVLTSPKKLICAIPSALKNVFKRVKYNKEDLDDIQAMEDLLDTLEKNYEDLTSGKFLPCLNAVYQNGIKALESCIILLERQQVPSVSKLMYHVEFVRNMNRILLAVQSFLKGDILEKISFVIDNAENIAEAAAEGNEEAIESFVASHPDVIENCKTALAALRGIMNVTTTFNPDLADNYKDLVSGNLSDTLNGGLSILGNVTAAMSEVAQGTNVENNLKKASDCIEKLKEMSGLFSGNMQDTINSAISTVENAIDEMGKGAKTEIGKNNAGTARTAVELLKGVTKDVSQVGEWVATCAAGGLGIVTSSVDFLQIKGVHRGLSHFYKKLLLKTMGPIEDPEDQAIFDEVFGYEWAKYDHEMHASGDFGIRQKSAYTPLLRFIETFDLSPMAGDEFAFLTLHEFVEKHGVDSKNYKQKRQEIINQSTETPLAEIELAFLCTHLFWCRSNYGDVDEADKCIKFLSIMNGFLQRIAPDFAEEAKPMVFEKMKELIARWDDKHIVQFS